MRNDEWMKDASDDDGFVDLDDNNLKAMKFSTKEFARP